MAATITSITGLQNLTGLTTFYADRNLLTTVDLSGMTSLVNVDVSNNTVDGEDKSLTSINLTGCTNIETLYINDSNFLSGGASSITGLSDLTLCQDLDLDGCDISGTVDLSTLSNLVYLDVSINNIENLIISDTSAPIVSLLANDNALTVSSVNDILINLDGSGVSAGDVNMIDGTNAAPSGSGVDAAVNLVGKGWTLSFNTAPGFTQRNNIYQSNGTGSLCDGSAGNLTFYASGSLEIGTQAYAYNWGGIPTADGWYQPNDGLDSALYFITGGVITNISNCNPPSGTTLVFQGSSVELPYEELGSYTGRIYWGDGTSSTNSYANRSHTYESPGTYTVIIEGTLTGFSFASIPTSATKLIEVQKWGNLRGLYNDFTQMFFGCTNLSQITATDTLNLSGVISLNGMFSQCTNLTTVNNINLWDISSVTDISNMFAGCTLINPNIGSWNVSNVTEMSNTFFDAYAFNQDISDWNVSNVTSMRSMFENARAFNQNIGIWDVSSVTAMAGMFANAYAFNQDIGSWNVSNVTDMTAMFSVFGDTAAFNQDLSGWCVTNIPTAPTNFDSGATAWILPKPVWGTCP